MGLFSKDKMSLYDFCFNFHEVMLETPEYDLKTVNPDGILSQEEELIIKKSIPLFRIVVFSILLSEYCSKKNLNYSSEQVGRHNSKALCSVLYNKFGFKDEEISDFANAFMEMYEKYINFLESIPSSDIQSRGYGFYLCRKLAQDIEPSVQNEESRMRGFVVFDIAKQIYVIVESMFKKLTKEYKIV